MKIKNILIKFLYIAIFFIYSKNTIYAQQKQLNSSLSFLVYYAPPQYAPYVEVGMLVEGNSIQYQKTNKGFEGAIEITILFKQNEQVINYDKYNLYTLPLADTTLITTNITDQKHYALKTGQYEVEIIWKDLINNQNTNSINQKINIQAFDNQKINISDILLVDKYENANTPNDYTKSGYNLYPNIVGFYPAHLNMLTFYAEIYNTVAILDAEQAPFLTTCSIKNATTDQVVNELQITKREKAEKVNVVFNSFNIENLKSGNYNVVIEVRNKKNELLTTQKAIFFRSKKIETAEAQDAQNLFSTANIETSFTKKIKANTLDFYLKALKPIAKITEKDAIDNVLKTPQDTQLLRRTLYAFWEKRDPLDPENAFNTYIEKINFVQQKYKSALFRGFETDRGRVYLQYGTPNDMQIVANEPGAMPYEIWQYYKIGNQTNVQFVFANFNTSDNEYKLLHSDYRTETHNPRWKLEILNAFKQHSNSNDFDNTDIRNHSGTRIGDFK